MVLWVPIAPSDVSASMDVIAFITWVYWYLLGEPCKSGAEMGNPNPTEPTDYDTLRTVTGIL